MDKNYVRSLIDGRMRLRHPIFGTDGGLKTVQEVFKDEKKITEIRPGQSSVLIFFDPTISGEEICKRIEEALPELTVCPETSHQDPVKDILGISKRQLGLRSLASLLCLTTMFGFFGSKTMHVWAGGAFLALSILHIWDRRKAI